MNEMSGSLTRSPRTQPGRDEFINANLLTVLYEPAAISLPNCLNEAVGRRMTTHVAHRALAAPDDPDGQAGCECVCASWLARWLAVRVLGRIHASS